MKVDPQTGEILDQEDRPSPFLPALIEPPSGTATIKVPPITQDDVIKGIANEVYSIQKYAQNMQITDLQGERKATNDLATIANIRKKVEAKRKEWLDPLKAHEKSINEAFQYLFGPLKAADETLRKKLLTHRQEQEAQRKAQEEAARLQALANQAAVEAARKANATEVEIQPIPEVTAPPPVKTMRADVGTATTIKVPKWRYKPGLSRKEILEKLPIEYHTINETMIGQLVRAKNKNQITEADFGGVIEIYEEDSLRVAERF